MAEPPRRGRFVALEGGDGAGKSTQARMLVGSLGGLGLDVLSTREPGGSPGAEDIRRLLVTGAPGRWDPLTEALLLNAARRDHWLRAIGPALRAGRWVVSDRFADSTLVYQGAAGGAPREVLEGLHRLALDGARPDLTLLLDIPPERGLARARGRELPLSRGGTGPEDRFERKDDAFHRRVRDAYLDLARAAPERIAPIDGSRGVAEVAADILAAVRARFAGELPE